MTSAIPRFGATGEPPTAVGGTFPTRDELSHQDRTTIALTAGVDYVGRTAAASLLAATVMPLSVGSAKVARERDHLGFYAELAAAHDPVVSFPPPTTMPRIQRQPANRIAHAMAKGAVDTLSFESPFATVNPEFRDVWKSFERNNVAHAQHWRHADGPRPTLCVIHGYTGSSHWFNALLFDLSRVYRSGCDVLLCVLPFHGARAGRLSPFSGHGYFSHGLTGFNESMAQAVHDLRVFIDYLESTGVQKVGVTGVSLGGLTSALLASVEDRLQVVVPQLPVTDVGDLLTSWFPISKLLDAALRMGTIDRGLVDRSLAYSSPLNYRPLVAKEGRLIITGLGDRCAPPHQSEQLWRHWDRCEVHGFPGGHLLHVGRRNFLHRIMTHLRDNDFITDSPGHRDTWPYDARPLSTTDVPTAPGLSVGHRHGGPRERFTQKEKS